MIRRRGKNHRTAKGQADNNAHAFADPTPPTRSQRIKAPQFELRLEETRQLSVGDIHADGDIQVRARMDDDAIEDYAKRMREGDTFPPIVVFSNGMHLWLADGFHRLEATRRAELETIRALVKRSGRRDAIKHALGANLSHGLRRANADKRRVVEIALREFSDTDPSDRLIAELCGVGNALVGDVRRQVCDPNTSSVRIGLDGKKYPAKTAAKKKPQPGIVLDPAPTDLSLPAGIETHHDAPNTGAPVIDQEQPAPLQFALADGSESNAGAWTGGWIEAKHRQLRSAAWSRPRSRWCQWTKKPTPCISGFSSNFSRR